LSFLFYSPELLPNSKEITLSDEEGRHALRVLRMQVGDKIQLLDGNGGLYVGEIISTQGKRCLIQLTDYQNFKSNRAFQVHIAIAPTKNTDRIEWFVEKAIEIGIDKITFLLTNHSERKVLKMERIQKIAISAMKQSGNFYLPELVELTKLPAFLQAQSKENSQKFMAYVPANPAQTLFSEKQEGDICVLIGPEGGFSSQEVELAEKADFKAVSLGKTRLRTETAGVVACSVLNF
jgi:16S rRNA (uracil1498-N3)-methyltransferase